MAVLDDRRVIAPRRLANVAADVAASTATVLAFGMLFAMTLGLLA